MPVISPDVSHIRRQLVARRRALAERHERVERDLARMNDPLVADADDRAIQLANDETLAAIDLTAKGEIAAIDAAVARLDSGLYGACARCNGRIESARLHAVPHAVTCAACEMG